MGMSKEVLAGVGAHELSPHASLPKQMHRGGGRQDVSCGKLEAEGCSTHSVVDLEENAGSSEASEADP